MKIDRLEITPERMEFIWKWFIDKNTDENDEYYQKLTIPYVDYDYMEAIFTKYLIGYHFIGNYVELHIDSPVYHDKEEAYLLFIASLIFSKIPYYKYLAERFAKENVSAPDNRIRVYTSIGTGVGEISPINAVVGDIETPTSKTNTNVDTTDIEKDALLTKDSYKTNLMVRSITELVAEDIINMIVAEKNMYF